MLKLKLQYYDRVIRRGQFTGKAPEAGKDWRQKEKGVTEDKMRREHHQFKGQIRLQEIVEDTGA